jgi:nucleotide-binding universal stress UspA family protein
MIGTAQIVVGVDGSPAGRRALHWAALEARRRGASVRALIAWRWDTAENVDTISSAAADEASHTISRELQSLPADLRDAVTISTEAVEGRPADVLTKAAQHADLLVLGSHGHSHRLQLVLGSVAEECVRNAMCPVLVLPPGFIDLPR